jgi:hypothetical protein
MKRASLLFAVLGVVLPCSQILSAESLNVIKTEYGTHSLSVVDLDKDGHSEIIVANRDHGSIEIFFKKVEEEEAQEVTDFDNNFVLSNHGYESRSIPVEVDLYGLNVIDLNLDGRADFLYHGAPEGLHYQLQNEDGEFSKALEFKLELALDQPESMVSRVIESGVEVVLQHRHYRSHLLIEKKGKGVELLKQRRFTTPNSEKGYFLSMNWGQGNAGKEGLWVSLDKRATPISFYERQGMLEMDYPQHWRVPQTRFTVQGHFFDHEVDDFIQVRSEKGQLFRLEHEKGMEGQKSDLSSRLIPYAHSDSRRFTFHVSDLDEDGEDELLVAHRDSASLEVVDSEKGSIRPGELMPSYRDVQWLGRSGKDILLYSSKEGMAGVSRLEKGKVSFPKLLKRKEVVVGLVAGIDQKESYPLLAKDDQLILELGSEFLGIELERPWPSSASMAKLTAKAHPELLLHLPYQGMKIFTWSQERDSYVDFQSELPFFEVEAMEDVKAEMVQTIKGESGIQDLSISQGGFIRRYRCFPETMIVEQINLPRSGSLSSAHIYVDLLPYEGKELVSLDRERKELDVFVRKDKSFEWVTRYRLHIDEPQGLAVFRHKERVELICYGAGESEWIGHSKNVDHIQAKPLDLREDHWQSYYWGESLRLEKGLDVLALFDANRHYLDLFGYREGKMKRFSSFPILEKRNFRKKGSPVGAIRQMMAASLEEGKKHAILTLLDDRILIYERP